MILGFTAPRYHPARGVSRHSGIFPPMRIFHKNEEFLRKIRRLKEEYPMVCIRHWTPEDFHAACNGPDHSGNRGEANWDDPEHVATARAMERICSEDPGKDWMLVRKAARDGKAGNAGS